jgi:molybdopterin-guanine dinucleotide biosynthesis protein A
MGREKPLQVVGGVSMIERVRAAVSHCVDELVIVTNRPDLYAFLGMPMISDIYSERGPLGGIQAALGQLRSPAALVVATDYPFLEPGALRRIVGEDPAGGVVVPRVAGRLHPLCALYAKDCATVLEESLAKGELMVLSFVARLRQKVLDETELGGPEAASRIFFNVNTPEDLRRAEEILAQAQPRG